MSEMDHIIRSQAEITPEWLSGLLGKTVVELTASPVGSGQMCRAYLLSFRESANAEEQRLVVKISSDHPVARVTGHVHHMYSSEVDFYHDLRDIIGEGHHVPICYYSAIDGDGWLTVLLEYIPSVIKIDQFEGASFEQARTALIALARLQAPVLNEWMKAGSLKWFGKEMLFLDPATYLANVGPYIKSQGDRLTPEKAEYLTWFGSQYSGWVSDLRPPLGLCHHDYRSDNLIFPSADHCVAVDWQTLRWGPAMRDVAYYMASSLTAEVRRKHDRELFKIYIDELNSKASVPWALGTAWEEYCRQTLYGISVVINTRSNIEESERGLILCQTLLDRFLDTAMECGAREKVESALIDGKVPKPLLAAPDDEDMHPVPGGGGELWNESYYNDFGSPDGSLGFYIRVGQQANLNRSMIYGAVVRPNRPSIMILDENAPLAVNQPFRQTVTTPKVKYEHFISEPLKTMTIKMTAIGRVYEDPASILKGGIGDGDETVVVNLTWKTQGALHKWRLTPRYEVPCRVTGTVTIDGETYEINAGGQRDHSWSRRDWVTFGWTWGCFHFTDQSHTNHYAALTNREPTGQCFGYIQRPGDALINEVVGAVPTTSFLDNGLVDQTSLSLATVDGSPVSMTMKIIGEAPLVIVQGDGRSTYLLRSYVQLTTLEGVIGHGWVEWNQPQHEVAK